MPPDLIRWTRDTFAPAPLFVMYGQTEATARLSYLPPELADAKAGSIGRGIPGVELLVFNDKGRECAIGALGHLAAEGLAQRRRLVGLEAEALAPAGVHDPVHVVPAVQVREEQRDVRELLLEQVQHRAGRVREGPVGGGRRG